MQLFAIDTAELDQQGTIVFAGAACTIKTNSADLLRRLGDGTVSTGKDLPALTMHLFVNKEHAPLAALPHFRGQHHVAIASFGPADVFVFDLLRHHVSGTVTAAVAADVAFWKEKLLPLAVGVMGASIGVLPAHAACFAHAGEGFLVAGASGAGKSTLSAALSKASPGLALEYLADDWTYITLQQGRLAAHGIHARIKLLPDAVDHFPVLETKSTHITMNGELAYEVHPAQVFGAQMQQQCTPRWLFFLERSEEPGIAFTPLDPGYARTYLEQNVERLPLQMPEASLRRARLIDAVAALPAWNLRYSGSPDFAAARLKDFIATLQQECA